MQSRGGGIKLINTINSIYEYRIGQALPQDVLATVHNRALSGHNQDSIITK